MFVSASPMEEVLRSDVEIRKIHQRIASSLDRKRFVVTAYFAVRTSDLTRILLEHPPNILHFSGHGDEKEPVLIRAGHLMGDRIEVGTTQITNRLTDFNTSVDTLSKAMEGQARESAETAKKLATQINTATADNVAAIKGVLARIQETVVRDVSAKNELQDLSRRIGALTTAIEKIEYLTPRPRSIREYFMTLRW